ncbi:MAG: hypothetical protein ACREQ5_07675, partial [Candidatus Dormibacteria bacterium]
SFNTATICSSLKRVFFIGASPLVPYTRRSCILDGLVLGGQVSSGVKHYYVADGFLELWNSSAKAGEGAFVPIRPLHNHNRTIFTSASTSLLKDGLEQIAEREQLSK